MKPEQELRLIKALRLDMYREPTPINTKAALSVTEARNSYNLPVIDNVWTFSDDSVYESRLTKANSSKDWYWTQADAAVAWRNHLARLYANRLSNLDRRISKIIGYEQPRTFHPLYFATQAAENKAFLQRSEETTLQGSSRHAMSPDEIQRLADKAEGRSPNE